MKPHLLATMIAECIMIGLCFPTEANANVNRIPTESAVKNIVRQTIDSYYHFFNQKGLPSPSVTDISIIGFQPIDRYLQVIATFRENGQKQVFHLIREKSLDGTFNGSGSHDGFGWVFTPPAAIQPCGTIGTMSGNQRLFIGGGIVNDSTISQIRVMVLPGNQSFIVPVIHHRCYFFHSRTRYIKGGSPSFQIMAVHNAMVKW